MVDLPYAQPINVLILSMVIVLTTGKYIKGKSFAINMAKSVDK